MNKFCFSMLLTLFPVLAAADDSLSFTPPASDYSVVFLGNIFGIVDGVLHGTGSQIMGSMFAVFNAAVLALGGIIITYTLLVSTMNTAHEGEMLGKQWSSIWIPIRSVIGLALLIPKASGYCLMQIFVMWIVVQGVGAADKIWDAALNYLNQGGVIIQAQQDPTKALSAANASGIANGAQIILAGQVCMLTLESALQAQLQSYKDGLSNPAGATGGCSGHPNAAMQEFCSGSVPSFTSTVNIINMQTLEPDKTQYDMPMPNFGVGSNYYALNGICGHIIWNAFPTTSFDNVKKNMPTISASDIKTASMSRGIAIQQMYVDLLTVAQTIADNDPTIGQNKSDVSQEYSTVAVQQFGVPHTASGPVCTDSSTPQCVVWGSVDGTSGAPLLNGTELQGAVADYDGVMLPTLNLISQANNASSANQGRQFIQNATTEGWIMAGSYFFDLVNLNVQASSGGGLTDTETGLDQSVFNVSALLQAFGSSSSAVTCTDPFGILCTWFGKDKTSVSNIVQLINGYGSGQAELKPADLTKQPLPTIKDVRSSTVYGYTNNAMVIRLPGQPGLQPLQFANAIHITIDAQTTDLPEGDFPCGNLKIMFWSTCLGSMFGDLFYNIIVRNIFNFVINILQGFINEIIMSFLQIPLQAMAAIFKDGLTIISTPGVNPIVALANMGTYYINFVGNLWITLIELSVVTAIFSPFLMLLFALVLPLLLAWVGVMLSVGFITAYYVPILPYMIFTFGAIAWMMAVMEAMVAAPIVALGVTHPEGHEAFGKGEQAIMILMNVFLRPSMMILGYILAIILSYVGVWVINAGFDNAIGFVQGSAEYGTAGDQPIASAGEGVISGGYSGWAGIYAYFFSILVYTMLYLTVVTKAFTLIVVLPDKVLRWIGGQQESYGADTSQWGEETKGKIDKAGEETKSAQQQMAKQLSGYANKGMGKAQSASSESSGGDVTAGDGEGAGGAGGAVPPG